MLWPSVCPSVCPYIRRRLNLVSHKHRHTIAQEILFLATKTWCNSTGVDADRVDENWRLSTNISHSRCISETVHDRDIYHYDERLTGNRMRSIE